jgi:hypothetical protein
MNHISTWIILQIPKHFDHNRIFHSFGKLQLLL